MKDEKGIKIEQAIKIENNWERNHIISGMKNNKTNTEKGRMEERDRKRENVSQQKKAGLSEKDKK